MSKIKSSGTTYEKELGRILWNKGYRYRKNYPKLPGKPDLVFSSYKVVVFIDGEFWHGFNWQEKKNRIKSNRDYWIPKIEKNMLRDKEVNEKLINAGWTVIRLWEKELKDNILDSVRNIQEVLDHEKSN